MSNIQIQLTADPTAEEAAAAIAAIVSLIAVDADSAEEAAAPANRWRDASRLTTQGLTPARTPARPGWGTIERIRRADKGGGGITGM